MAIMCAATATEGAARAAPPSAHLEFVRLPGAEKCPDEAAVREAVAARLGYDPFSPAAESAVSVIFGPSGHGLHARIELVDEHGEVTHARELTARGTACDQLASTVELSISMAINPLAFAEELGALPERPQATEVAPAKTEPQASGETPQELETATPIMPPIPPAPAPPATVVKPAPQPPKLRPRIGTGFITAVGTAPTVAFGFTLHVGLRARYWSANVEIRADVPASAATPNGGGVSTGLYGATLVPCFHYSAFAACGLFTVAAMVSKGEGFALSFERSSPYVAAGVRAALEIPLGRIFAVLIAADLVAPIVSTVLIANDTQVFSTPPVAGVFQFAGLGHFR